MSSDERRRPQCPHSSKLHKISRPRFPERRPLLAVGLIVFALSLSFAALTALQQQQQQQPDIQDAGTENGPSTPHTTRHQLVARAQDGLEAVRDWSLRFGREIHQVSQEATCQRALRDQFDPARGDAARRGPYRATVTSTDWTRVHADIVRTISTSMGWTREAVEAIVRASETLAGNHTHDDALHADYVDVHRLYDVSELAGGSEAGGGVEGGDDDQGGVYPAGPAESASDGNSDTPPATGSPDPADNPEQQLASEQLATPQPLLAFQPAGTPMPDEAASEWRTPARYLKLERHANFGDVPISTETSAVHTPVHVYPGEPAVMNAIAWSEDLTRVFRNNFVQNPKLSNQYFASPLGFMRLFPAQKWQIPRTDPDLYDARMRPWYAAGASSRKDVIVLLDASGSMTGSRRDIAKGVTFEILDTLTDNDHFLVLKFNDIVQQVGVPACEALRLERRRQARIPLKNTVFQSSLVGGVGGPLNGGDPTAPSGGGGGQSPNFADSPPDSADPYARNGTDLDGLYLLPATGRNVRYLKTNFTLATSGIANFSHALVTAFEVLRKYQDHPERLGAQCNQAIMLVTDGSPSDFEDIFSRYNYPNAPVRVFTYLIGRETSTSDGSHTKMMACHNRGYYTHVINLAEVRETVQQYLPVMARPLVLNRTHPTTWTPAYGELTYQMLTDWIWESRRRERARAMIAAAAAGVQLVSGSPAGGLYRPDIRVVSSGSDSAPLDEALSGYPSGQDGTGSADTTAQDDLELEAVDIFGYDSNPDCFWETRRNDLLTTVVQPVYDPRNMSRVVDKFLAKNMWTKKESVVRTANLLGVAAADMKINDIVGLAPSHRLGPNGYAILLTNNGLVMHHPDLRSILEPFPGEAPTSAASARILKPFFSSLDFVQVEHILGSGGHTESNNSQKQEEERSFAALRDEAVQGKTGWRELTTKRTLDCQRRVQSRRQSFYYKPLEVFPFAFLVAIPQPYGSYRVEAQVELKNHRLPEKLTTYFTTSDFDLWSVHPDYAYCDGPSNNTVATLLDMLARLETADRLNEIQWRPAESTKPPLFSPDKIICDKQLVQSLVFDALATYSFSDNCGPPSPSAESSLFSMFGVRFSFVATRAGLTRVRHYNAEDLAIKREALAFARRHARALDETYYARTVDYNMLINDTATLLQVPFNAHLKLQAALSRWETMEGAEGGSSGGGGSELAPDGSPLRGSAQTPPPNSESGSSRLELREMSLFEKMELLANGSGVHVVATQALIVNEGAQRAVAGVTGVFYDYASFVMRFLNTTNTLLLDGQDDDESQQAARARTKPASCYLASGAQDEACAPAEPRGSWRAQMKCGQANDTLDCLLVDNNGYLLLSERLEFVGRHLRAYDANLMTRLVQLGVFHEVNITDYQSICIKRSDGPESGGGGGGGPGTGSGKPLGASSSSAAGSSSLWRAGGSSSVHAIASNLAASLVHLAGVLATLSGYLIQSTLGHQLSASQQSFQAVSALLPNKSYLRPCDRVLTRYETRPGQSNSADTPQYFTTAGPCPCPAWFTYEQVPKTNLILLLVDHSAPPACKAKCDQQQRQAANAQDPLRDTPATGQDPGVESGGTTTSDDDDSLMTQYNIIGTSEAQVCSMFERESRLSKRRLDSCIAHHPDEEEIKLCGRAAAGARLSMALLLATLAASVCLSWRHFYGHSSSL